MSVYEVSTDVEEAVAMAALQLTHPQKNNLTSRVWMVRIRESELKAEGVQIKHTGGTTGVRKIDESHRDLYASNGFLGLTRSLFKAQVEGEDRVRQMKQPVLAHMLEIFAQLPDGEISDNARKKCCKMLELLDRK